MTLQEFKASLSLNEPPFAASVYLQSLWFDATGNWNAAHETIQDMNDKSASWIHAYLHRKEGDIFNADYWYSKAGKERPSFALQEEWEQLVKAFL